MNTCKIPQCLIAPAKLNLGLSIVGRRSDGYHELESLFWPIDLSDELQITEGNVPSTVEWAKDAPIPSPLPGPEEELVARLLQRLPRETRDLSVKITKKIPLGGGLGGGSSDVGTVLKELVRRGRVSASEGEKIALAMGCDVPFFLRATPAWVTGVGERIQPVTVSSELRREVKFLILLLPQATPTREVFDAYRESRREFSQRRSAPSGLNWDKLSEYLAEAENDLEIAASKVTPLISEVLRQLRITPCIYAGLSGSGSTCFAVYRSETQRRETLKDLQQFCRKNDCKSLTAETFENAY